MMFFARLLLLYIIIMEETPQKQTKVNFGTKSPAPLQLNVSEDDVALTLDISNKILRSIYCNRSENQSLTELLNHELRYIRLIKSDRLESRLYTEGCRVRREYNKIKSGYGRNRFEQKTRKIAVLNNEVGDISDIDTARLAVSMTEISKSNEKENISYANEGPRIDNSSKTVKKKVIRNLEQNVNKALDFVETYGALPKSLTCESFDGELCVLTLDGCNTPGRNPNFNNMKSPEKQNVRKLLQVCDNSMVSDSAYHHDHELSMQVSEMPRKHLLVSCRNEVNSKYAVKRTPGMLPGSFLSLKTELTKDLLTAESEGMRLPDTVKLKVSGDGAKVSKISNFIVISYAHLENMHTLSHINQRVLAIVKCDENYENLEKSCGPIFSEINDLQKNGVLIGEKKVKLELFIGGDMEFLQILLGLSSSISIYACPWCKVPKDERGNISFPIDYYHGPDLRRSVSDIKTLAASATKQKYGVLVLVIEPEVLTSTHCLCSWAEIRPCKPHLYSIQVGYKGINFT